MSKSDDRLARLMATPEISELIAKAVQNERDIRSSLSQVNTETQGWPDDAIRLALDDFARLSEANEALTTISIVALIGFFALTDVCTKLQDDRILKQAQEDTRLIENFIKGGGLQGFGTAQAAEMEVREG